MFRIYNTQLDNSDMGRDRNGVSDGRNLDDIPEKGFSFRMCC